MTLTIKDVPARMAKVAAAVTKGNRATVEAAALKTKTTIASGAPDRLRNVGKKGAKLGVRYTIRGEGSNVSALVKATGPWPLIEENIPAHLIGPKKKKRGARSGRGGGVVVNGGVFRLVHHPGTKGKHPWAKGVTKAEPVVAKEMSKRTANIAAAAFRG